MSYISNKGAAPISIFAGSTFQTSTDANLASMVGTRYDLADGRQVILVSVSSAGVATSGHLMQDAALIANHQNATVGTFTAYSATTQKQASVIITIGATAMTANQYQGGFLVVNSGTGIGQCLRVASNTASIASGTQGVITLEDSPNVALVASDSRISFVPAHGLNVVDSPTTRTNVEAGVALYPIAASSYGFLVAKGITSALSDASIAGVGYAIAPSVTTAGAITVATSTGSTLTNAVIGYTAIAGVSAEARPVFVNL
jgi:hypothetical protein